MKLSIRGLIFLGEHRKDQLEDFELTILRRLAGPQNVHELEPRQGEQLSTTLAKAHNARNLIFVRLGCGFNALECRVGRLINQVLNYSPKNVQEF